MATFIEPRRLEDRAEDALVEVDKVAHQVFGSDESRWSERQCDEYIAACNTVRALYAEGVAR